MIIITYASSNMKLDDNKILMKIKKTNDELTSVGIQTNRVFSGRKLKKDAP